MTARAWVMMAAAAFGVGGWAHAWREKHWDHMDPVFNVLYACLAILQAWWMSRDHSSRVPEWMKRKNKKGMAHPDPRGLFNLQGHKEIS